MSGDPRGGGQPRVPPVASSAESPSDGTLLPPPDLLRPNLRLVFVGINPGVRSAQVGHYFAAPTNRFWRAANAAGIFDPALGPESDREALSQGIGFTDIVKRPSARASEIRTSEFREGAHLLKARLLRVRPAAVCFNGMTAYRNFLKYAGDADAAGFFGRQAEPIGDATAFAVPSPSPANARFSLEDLVRWYGVVARWLEERA